MMKVYKKTISVFLAFVLVFSGLPVQFMNFDGNPQAHAEVDLASVNLEYEGFSNTGDLQLNGDSLIVDNVIQFESKESPGESVFTKDKITLGENLSFSTAFSFRNISPSSPSGEKKGGFTFTLQPGANTAIAADFHDESIQPSISIAFVTDYFSPIPTAKVGEPLLLASLSGFDIAQEPPIRCEISTRTYINGDYDNGYKGYIDSYYVDSETSEYYNVWIGYDGVAKELRIITLDLNSNYTHQSYGLDLPAEFEPDVYVGFMGSIGDAQNKSEISQWYFRNDLSIIDGASIDDDLLWLTDEILLRGNSSLENVTSDLFLPTEGAYGSTINWESSNTNVVSIDGKVTTPSK